ALEPTDVLLGVSFEQARAEERFAFHELSRRHGDFAIAGAAASARNSPGGLTGLRIVAFGISDRPVLLAHAAALAEAGSPAEFEIGALKEAIIRDAEIPEDAHYSRAMRLHSAAVMVQRCLRDLADAESGK